MLAGASHAHKVNFCKFTNETRFAMEDASTASGQSISAPFRGLPRAEATSWHSPATRSFSPTTAIRVCRCPSSHSSRCCRGRAVSRASPTSARCAAIAQTSSARSRKASKASAPRTGASSTRSVTRSRMEAPCRRQRRGLPRYRIGRRPSRASSSRRSSRSATATLSSIRAYAWISIAPAGARRS